jgi:hypothetical protein
VSGRIQAGDLEALDLLNFPRRWQMCDLSFRMEPFHCDERTVRAAEVAGHFHKVREIRECARNDGRERLRGVMALDSFCHHANIGQSQFRYNLIEECALFMVRIQQGYGTPDVRDRNRNAGQACAATYVHDIAIGQVA